jgi:hypothetical protein
MHKATNSSRPQSPPLFLSKNLNEIMPNREKKEKASYTSNVSVNKPCASPILRKTRWAKANPVTRVIPTIKFSYIYRM